MNDQTPDIDQIIEKQGWTDHTLLCLARDFIAAQGMTETWAEVLTEIAAEENSDGREIYVMN